jgi:hypothetical protein
MHACMHLFGGKGPWREFKSTCLEFQLRLKTGPSFQYRSVSVDKRSRCVWLSGQMTLCTSMDTCQFKEGVYLSRSVLHISPSLSCWVNDSCPTKRTRKKSYRYRFQYVAMNFTNFHLLKMFLIIDHLVEGCTLWEKSIMHRHQTIAKDLALFIFFLYEE